VLKRNTSSAIHSLLALHVARSLEQLETDCFQDGVDMSAERPYKTNPKSSLFYFVIDHTLINCYQQNTHTDKKSK